MRILILQTGDNYVDLTRTFCNIHGTRHKVNESTRLAFDGRVGAPRKHLMKRVIGWVNERSRSDVKIMILPGGALTELLIRKVKEKAMYSELLQPQYKEPSIALDSFARKIQGSSNFH